MTDYTKMKVAELKALCKERGFPVSGTKAVLISRLDGTSTVVPKKKKKTVTKEPIAVQQTVSKPILYLRRNQHGYFEHLPTKLVFCPDTKRVIGKQGESGDIEELVEEDLVVCKEHFFNYRLPQNLD